MADTGLEYHLIRTLPSKKKRLVKLGNTECSHFNQVADAGIEFSNFQQVDFGPDAKNHLHIQGLRVRKDGKLRLQTSVDPSHGADVRLANIAEDFTSLGVLPLEPKQYFSPKQILKAKVIQGRFYYKNLSILVARGPTFEGGKTAKDYADIYVGFRYDCKGYIRLSDDTSTRITLRGSGNQVGTKILPLPAIIFKKYLFYADNSQQLLNALDLDQVIVDLSTYKEDWLEAVKDDKTLYVAAPKGRLIVTKNLLLTLLWPSILSQ